MSQTAQAILFPSTQPSVQGPWKLPSGWEWVPLGKLCEAIVGGGTPDRGNPRYWGGTIPWASVKDLKSDELTSTQETITPEGLKSSAARLVEPGTIIVATRMGLGKVCIARTRLAINQDLKGLVLRPNALSRYVVFFLKSRASDIEGRGSGATVKGIKLEELKAWPVPLPFPHNSTRSLDIQHRIVARIEALLAELKEIRNLAAAIRRDTDRVMEAALEEVFGLIRNGFEVTGIPQDQIKPIGKVAQLERGKFTHRPRNDRQFFGGTTPWVQIQNIPKDYSKYITDYMDTLNERGLAISKLFPTGTLVVSIAATIGAVGILQFDAGFPDSLVGITADTSRIEPGFLYWQLCYLRDHLETVAPAAAQKNINLQLLNRINLWVPPIPEQKAINAHLNAIQAEIGDMRRLQAQDAKLLDQLEQSVLERAFRGEL